MLGFYYMYPCQNPWHVYLCGVGPGTWQGSLFEHAFFVSLMGYSLSLEQDCLMAKLLLN